MLYVVVSSFKDLNSHGSMSIQVNMLSMKSNQQRSKELHMIKTRLERHFSIEGRLKEKSARNDIVI